MTDTWRGALELLSSGSLVSGADIGAALGVSRSAVWKQLQRLQEWGVPIEKIRGRGYRLVGGMELLSRQRILGLLSEDAKLLLGDLVLLEQVDSTNTVARRQIEQGIVHSYVCMAERQTQGRGRLGRTWVSPFGRNLYLSATWEFSGGVAALEGLSLAVGVAVSRAVQSLGVEVISLKWPNDILLNGRKVGGVLLEMLGDPSGLCQVVVGIGINVAMPRDVTIDQPWADLDCFPGVTRNGLAGAVLAELLPLLATYAETRFRGYRRAWEELDAYSGEPVRLLTPGRVVEGVARGVSDTGAICLDIDGTRSFYSGGEISLRKAL